MPGTGLGELVEDQRGARQFGDDGQEARAADGSSTTSCGRDCGGYAGDECQPDGVKTAGGIHFPRTDKFGSERDP